MPRQSLFTYAPSRLFQAVLPESTGLPSGKVPMSFDDVYGDSRRASSGTSNPFAGPNLQKDSKILPVLQMGENFLKV